MTMHQVQPHHWQRSLQRLPASRAGSWVFSKILHYVDRAFLRLTTGRLSIPGLFSGLPVITVTTIGAKSGKPRTLPLVGILDGDKVVLIASNWGGQHHPAWYYNLRAHPEATLSIEGHTGTYSAHEVTGDEYEKYWNRAVELYTGYAAYKQRTGGRQIPILVLTPKVG
jgi:deazaflavin-dependent oxidoreductase (nitroreductase family)